MTMKCFPLLCLFDVRINNKNHLNWTENILAALIFSFFIDLFTWHPLPHVMPQAQIIHVRTINLKPQSSDGLTYQASKTRFVHETWGGTPIRWYLTLTKDFKTNRFYFRSHFYQEMFFRLSQNFFTLWHLMKGLLQLKIKKGRRKEQCFCKYTDRVW